MGASLEWERDQREQATQMRGCFCPISSVGGKCHIERPWRMKPSVSMGQGDDWLGQGKFASQAAQCTVTHGTNSRNVRVVSRHPCLFSAWSFFLPAKGPLVLGMELVEDRQTDILTTLNEHG